VSAGRRGPLVFGLILGGHVLVVLILEHSVLTSRSRMRPLGVAPMSAILMEDRRQLTTQPAEGARTPNALLFTPKAPQMELPEAPHPQFENEPTVSSPIDWSSAAHAAATDLSEREQQKSGRRSFTHTPAAPDSPGVFGSEKANHRAGAAEGGTQFWVTDNCYFDIPRGSPSPRFAGEFHLLTPTCKPPPTGGGTRMFEHLKPR
jgi:hypothetical protein